MVYGCFLDASKAFNLVDHHILVSKLGLPAPILCFLLGWCRSQQMRVHWNSCMSDSFSVSNGVRQRSVLSPILFAVYLDFIGGLTLWVQCAMQMTLLCPLLLNQLIYPFVKCFF